MKQSEKNALIIENDDYPEVSVLGYINDNPGLFDNVHEFVYAKYRMPEISEELMKHNITDIVAASTFMYKDQIEDTALLLHAKDRNYKFHLQYACQKLNDFVATKDGRLSNSFFWDKLDMMTILAKDWCKQGRIFEIDEDYDLKVPKDRFASRFHYNDEFRPKYTSKQIHYSDEYNVFHREDEQPTDKVEWVHR